MNLRAEDENCIPWYTLGEFAAMSRANPTRTDNRPIRPDARRSIEDLQAEVAAIAARTAGECGTRGVGRLWEA